MMGIRVILLACMAGMSYQMPQGVVPVQVNPEDQVIVPVVLQRSNVGAGVGIQLGPLAHFGINGGFHNNGLSASAGTSILGLGIGGASNLNLQGLNVDGGLGVGGKYTNYGKPTGGSYYWYPTSRSDEELIIPEELGVESRTLGAGYGLQFGPFGYGITGGLGPKGINVEGGIGFDNYLYHGTPLRWQPLYGKTQLPVSPIN